jgi:hypothetical protein
MNANILYPVMSKWTRAKTKADNLTSNISTFCKNNPISLEAKLREGRLGVDLICQMDNLEVPLKEWSIELGEIVYSLRSSLDNLIYVCAQHHSDPPPNPRRLKFPIIQDTHQYPNEVRDITPQISPDISNLLMKIQPFQRSNPEVESAPEFDPLVLLNWISNHDKHRLPVPFLVAPKAISINQTCEFESEQDASKNVPPDVLVHAVPLSHGNKIIEYRTKHPVKRICGKMDITAHVAFNSSNGACDLSEAMNQLTWYTKLIIDEFSKELR